jgi:hypothetical protein
MRTETIYACATGANPVNGAVVSSKKVLLHWKLRQQTTTAPQRQQFPSLVCQIVNEFGILSVLSHQRFSELEDRSVDRDCPVALEHSLDLAKGKFSNGHLFWEKVTCTLWYLGQAPTALRFEQGPACQYHIAGRHSNDFTEVWGKSINQTPSRIRRLEFEKASF